jgi:hypothetical protein
MPRISVSASNACASLTSLDGDVAEQGWPTQRARPRRAPGSRIGVKVSLRLARPLALAYRVLAQRRER